MQTKSLLHSFFALGIGAFFSHPALAAWEIDPSHTHVSFQVGHLGLTHTPGIFRKVDGKLVFDDKKVEASRVTFAIDADSIDTVHVQRDTELRGASWFDAAKHPRIGFASTSVRRIDDQHYVINGDLTIRGKTLPVAFNTVLTKRTVNPFLKVPMVGFIGSTIIRRSDFGMTEFMAVIADEVELKIALELIQKP
jgi:polyisoprenoid-binding protein YceI